MRDDLLQEIATIGLIFGAAFYVVRRAWLTFHPQSSSEGGCGGGCSSCPSSTGAAAPEHVVSIGMPASRPGKSV
jgi:FeoB-associated Cys-rich membrane protein